MQFHELLKHLRISKDMGLRDFAHKIGMDVGNYSKMERGLSNPPQKEELFDNIATVLVLSFEEKENLKGMATLAQGRIQKDIVDDIKEYEYLPVLLRTIANKQLTNEQLKELTDRINRL